MFRYLAACCYRAVYLLHHALCLRPGVPLENSKLIVVGSFRTGGAGKTPFCIWLAEQFVKNQKRVAILCHRYAFDEAAMLQRHFAGNPQVKVFATDNRYRLSHKLDQSHRFDIILCDDGFEDSRLVGEVALTLSWENPPTKITDLWPLKNARSLARDHRGKLGLELKCYGNDPDIRFVVDKILSLDNEACPPAKIGRAHVLCGLGDPERFCDDIRAYGIDIGQKFFLKDHDKNFVQKMEQALKRHPGEFFVISQKDAARLPQNWAKNSDFRSQVLVAHQKIVVYKKQSLLLYFKERGIENDTDTANSELDDNPVRRLS